MYQALWVGTENIAQNKIVRQGTIMAVTFQWKKQTTRLAIKISRKCDLWYKGNKQDDKRETLGGMIQGRPFKFLRDDK